jgi:hypothetical protein
MNRNTKRLILFALLCALALTAVQCKKSHATPDGTVYFLVSEINPFHGDSFILPLTDADAIAEARRIIRGEPGPRIVSARIAEGSGDGNYLNKDLQNPGRVWSWHVSEFFGFVDFTAEIYDGSPTWVEEHLENWMLQNQGIIGFWGYTVKSEADASLLR